MKARALKARIESASKIVVASHIRADGDAVGSAIGFGQSLIDAGRPVTIVLPDGVPQSYAFVPGTERVHQTLPKGADLVIALDCSDPGRLGPQFAETPIGINIDHHVTNTRFAELNYVVPDMPATAMICADLLFSWGYPLGQTTLDALMTGLVTDTLGFRTNNMTPVTLRMAARLMEAGARLTEMYEQALMTRSYAAAAYWGQGLSRLQRKDGLIWSMLTLDDRQAAGYYGNDDADLINVLSGIEGMQVALLFVQQKGDRVKVSWRARKGIDVSQLALQFGGGGHPSASGAEVSGQLEQVVSEVVARTYTYMQALQNTN